MSKSLHIVFVDAMAMMFAIVFLKFAITPLSTVDNSDAKSGAGFKIEQMLFSEESEESEEIDDDYADYKSIRDLKHQIIVQAFESEILLYSKQLEVPLRLPVSSIDAMNETITDFMREHALGENATVHFVVFNQNHYYLISDVLSELQLDYTQFIMPFDWEFGEGDIFNYRDEWNSIIGQLKYYDEFFRLKSDECPPICPGFSPVTSIDRTTLWISGYGAVVLLLMALEKYGLSRRARDWLEMNT